MKKINIKLQELITYIINFQNEFHISPTIRQMKERLNIKSTSTIDYYLTKLENKNIIKRIKNQTRSIIVVNEPNQTTIKIPNLICCKDNSYIYSDKNISSYPLYISKDLFNSERIFYIANENNNLIKYNINKGDILFVKETKDFTDSELCIVEINGEIQTKVIFHERNFYRLENGSTNSIYVKEVNILGKVIGVYKKF